MTVASITRPSKRTALGLLVAFMSVCAIGADSSNSTPSSPDYLRSNMNTAVDPGKDFFEYANGGWLARNPIPASESSWGIAKMVVEQLNVSLRSINERAAAQQHPNGSELQKIGDFWSTAMDTEKSNRLDIHPLDAELARIDRISDAPSALLAAFALKPLGMDAFFSVSVSQDEKNSDAMAVHLSQGGLGLPDRDFYFNPEKGVKEIRAQYLAHLERTLVLLGRDATQAKRDAFKVMAFETALAKASRRLEDLRDPQKNYNKMTLADVQAKKTPDIDWAKHLDSLGLRPDFVIVGQPEFLVATNRLLKATPAPVLRDYLRLHLVDAYASTLSLRFDEEQFRFYGKVLSGQKEQRERWKRVLEAQEQAMGMVLGKIFVQDFFPAEAKTRYVNMVEAIRVAYRARIEKLQWMSEPTKAKALQKLAAITTKVGYPDKWKDYSDLAIGSDSYCDNMMRANRWHFKDMVSKFGKPVDRTEWDMTPQTYNAYYNPSNNEIVLPAAIFTIPGLADAQADDAMVYGYAAASTIGHEITHGFDDEGRQFDAKGNLAEWWTAEDARKFQKQAQVMVKQFNAFEPLPGLHINGKASLGENIADFGGLLLGLDAFKNTEQYQKGKEIGGLTPMQRYFLGYALGWLGTEREEVLRSHLLSDVHAPAKWRVLGPLSNIPEFHEAFGVKPGQPMWRAPANRVNIW